MVNKTRAEVEQYGFGIVNSIYTNEEIELILAEIRNANSSNETFRKSKDLFAIRQFLKEVPSVTRYIFNDQMKQLLKEMGKESCFVTKSIYFDKPALSNWFVSYHQDLTISVDKKIDIEGFGPWTVKLNQFAVQPPIHVLENCFTIRIHLDDTDESNGALRVIPLSHKKGIYRASDIDWQKEEETNCPVQRGGVMIMKPLLLHASSKTTNNRQRRVIHIEFSDVMLPLELQWAEKLDC